MSILEYTEERHDWGESGEGKPPPGVMWVYYCLNEPKMVDFLCPCGCGNTCPTHLTTPDRPKQPNDRRWNYSPGPTLSPSIRWTGGCKAHFTITGGKVTMHEDSGK
jgi:hypothetical protein